MADQNIALGVQVPDAMKSISGMLNFVQQAQNLQTSRQDFERGGVTLERERALLKPAIEQGVAAASTATTGAARSKFQLQGEQQSAAMRIAGGLNGDPRIKSNDPDKVIEALLEARDQMIASGVPRQAAEWQTSQLISKAHQPGAVPQLIINAIRQNQDAAGQAANVNPPVSLVNTGGALHPAQLQPLAPGGMQPGGQPIPLTISPGETQTVGVGPGGANQVIEKAPAGNVTGIFAPPSGAGPAAAPGAPPLGPRMPQFQPGDVQELGPLTEHRTAARAALAQAGDLHQNNRGILEEIDKVQTGVVGPSLQRMFGAMGIGGAGFDSAEKRASAYDLLGKYLERNALQIAQTMGPHTNSGLETVKAAQGSTAYNPTAIKKITKLIDANVTGTEAYQPGLEKAIESSGGHGVLAIRQYQQQWGQNYDPRIPMLANAKKAGDREEYDAIMKTLGGPRSVAFQDLARKAANLDRLSTQGRLQ